MNEPERPALKHHTVTCMVSKSCCFPVPWPSPTVTQQYNVKCPFVSHDKTTNDLALTNFCTFALPQLWGVLSLLAAAAQSRLDATMQVSSC